MRYYDAKTEHIPENIRDILKQNTEIIDGESPQKKLLKGLVLGGVTGSGKTHCLHSIRETVKSWGEVSKVINWVELLFELKERMGQKEGLKSIIDTLSGAQFCFIDDLGAENDTNWGQEMLYLVVNRIYNKQGTLFISTNMTPEKLLEKYGERILSRLGHMCEFIDMPNKDYR